MHLTINLTTPLHDSFRVRQVLGMFDMPDAPTIDQCFTVELPDESEPWSIGVITGPTGSGKSSVARKAYDCNVHNDPPWPADRAVIDCFGDLPIRQITQMLTLVGFSSPPAWIKPYAVLSNGEKFRCDVARALLQGSEKRRNESPRRHGSTEGNSPSAALLSDPENIEMTKNEGPPLAKESPAVGRASVLPCLRGDPVPSAPVVIDEFTSLVDRTVAKISSAAISRAIRSGKINRRLVAVSCHDDIIPWLEPDWVLDMATQTLSRERLRRPSIQLVIQKCTRAAWSLFRRHHYLSANLHRSAQCYLGTIYNRPAAFVAVLPFPHPIRPGYREHRLVCLPDFQGIGIGSTMSACIASLYVTSGKPYFSTSSHPAVINSRAASPLWKLRRKPGLITERGTQRTGLHRTLSTTRLTAGFEYVGLARTEEAHELKISVRHRPRQGATSCPRRGRAAQKSVVEPKTGIAAPPRIR